MIEATTTLRKIAAMRKRIRVICGSQGASKTFSILMLLINHASSKEDRKILVVSEELSKMRPTVIADFIKIMKEWGIYEDSSWNSSEAIYRFRNGSTINFKGMDKLSIGKGLRCNVLFANEANKIDWEAYREISSRADNIFIDYNPNLLSWIDTEVIPREDCSFLRVTWRDNEFLGDAEKAEIMGYAEKAFNDDGSIKSEYWHNVWKVYSEGEVGSTIGAIFTDWSTGEYIETDLNGFGLDFGYSSDPDALIRVSIDNKHKVIYMKEELYQNGNSEDVLGSILKKKCSGHIIVADSAEDRLIADMKKKFSIRITPVKKPRVVESIKKLLGYHFVVDPNSVNLQKELQNYVWLDKVDKTIPIDKFNHLLDALRYIAEYLTVTQPKPSSVVVTGNRRRSGGPVISRIY